ncbi:hypothetical protein QCA50_004457 [Cerrena zonata]|uniref:DRBM domain-containing protein n=1 Tax=Cerrena zonata TaxID=2478898 RepID=A0AAW0GLL7_9APHY
MSGQWRMELNNYLQRNGCVNGLDMRVNPDGPPHRPTWTAVAFFNGVKYAQASMYSQQEALDEAARLTLELMYRQRGGRV